MCVTNYTITSGEACLRQSFAIALKPDLDFFSKKSIKAYSSGPGIADGQVAIQHDNLGMQNKPRNIRSMKLNVLTLDTVVWLMYVLGSHSVHLVKD